jgi:hypothetical protein
LLSDLATHPLAGRWNRISERSLFGNLATFLVGTDPTARSVEGCDKREKRQT